MLSARYRFHRRNHVARVHKKGRSVRSGSLALKYVLGNSKDIKVAVIVSKKVAKSAVTRNRIRRRVFELVRNHFERLPEGFEGIVSVYGVEAAKMPSDELKAHILELFDRAGLKLKE